MGLTEEQIIFLKTNVKGRTCQELADLMNKEFNTDRFKASSIKHYKRKHNLVSGVDTRFHKNQIPHNKKNIGYEFIDTKTGYTYIKTEMGWKLKNRYKWEQHNGTIPKGYSVVFADQDKNNFNTDNLLLVDNRDKLVAKNKKLFTSDRELTKTGLLIAKLSNKCYDKRKKG